MRDKKGIWIWITPVWPVWKSWWPSASLDGKWQSYTCHPQHSSAQNPSSFSHSMWWGLFALCVRKTLNKTNKHNNNFSYAQLSTLNFVNLCNCIKPRSCLESAVPESESGSDRSRPPTLLTMFRRWMAVQAKGMRKLPRRLHDCSACRRSLSSFSLCLKCDKGRQGRMKLNKKDIFNS